MYEFRLPLQGSVVTAPTNGVAGIIPAVICYMNKFLGNSLKYFDENKVINFLLTAGAIGILYQKMLLYLGLTCDSIGGLVQIPCIERNAMASMKAINAARMALNGDGQHFVSLDSVIKTMFVTGRDMMNKYKETSQGGLAVNIVEC